MATFRFELKSTPNRNSKYCVMLCVSVGGKRTRAFTGIAVDRPQQFNSKCKGDNWIRASVPDAKVWNQRLHDILEKAKTEYSQLASDNQATSNNIISNLKSGAVSPSFMEFAEQRLNEIRATGKYSTLKSYLFPLSKLEAYLAQCKKKDLLFSELTPEFLARFENFLRSLENKNGGNLHNNSIALILIKIRAIYRRAEQIRLVPTSLNPFLSYSIKTTKTDKEKLIAEEIEAISALQLKPGSGKWHARNCFLFAFYCAGMRISDLLQIRWSNVEGGRLHYQMTKSRKIMDMALVPQALAILDAYRPAKPAPDSYIFPLLDNRAEYAKAITQQQKDTLPVEVSFALRMACISKTSKLNAQIKEVAAMANITKRVTMHTARHSFAHTAMKGGVGNGVIKGLLAHSSIATTERYMGSFGNDAGDVALLQMFGDKPQEADAKSQLAAFIASLSQQEAAAILSNLKIAKP